MCKLMFGRTRFSYNRELIGTLIVAITLNDKGLAITLLCTTGEESDYHKDVSKYSEIWRN